MSYRFSQSMRNYVMFPKRNCATSFSILLKCYFLIGFSYCGSTVKANPMSTNADLISDGKNKYTVFCSRCPSKILNSGVGSYSDTTFKLPPMHHKKDCTSTDAEDITGYWHVGDMYLFENLGFSNTVDNIKYLICADCEIGPIGWHDLPTKQSYVAISRVKHS